RAGVRGPHGGGAGGGPRRAGRRAGGPDHAKRPGPVRTRVKSAGLRVTFPLRRRLISRPRSPGRSPTVPPDFAPPPSPYKPVLRPSLRSFSSFAAGFSYLSILTGVTQYFYLGYGAGGPAFFWTWPAVFAGQLLVALCFAELSARHPLAGGVYQ